MRWVMILAMALALGCGEEKKSENQGKKIESQEMKSENQEKTSENPVETSECRTGGEKLCKKAHEEGTKAFENCVARYIAHWCATNPTDS